MAPSPPGACNAARPPHSRAPVIAAGGRMRTNE